MSWDDALASAAFFRNSAALLVEAPIAADLFALLALVRGVRAVAPSRAPSRAPRSALGDIILAAGAHCKKSQEGAYPTSLQ